MCRLLCKPLCWVSTNIFENGFLSRMSGHIIRHIIHLITQYVTLLYGWINEQERWRESCILIGKLVRSRWLNVDVIPFCIYIDLDKNAKKNFADIQPSWPHAWSITHMSSNLNSFRDYLLTFERLCDTCSLHYFNFFFFMPFILCLILMLFMHFTLHQLFIHIALCRIFSHPWWCSLRKHPFLLALRRWGRFAGRNVCDSETEIPYWWRKSMFT